MQTPLHARTHVRAVLGSHPFPHLSYPLAGVPGACRPFTISFCFSPAPSRSTPRELSLWPGAGAVSLPWGEVCAFLPLLGHAACRVRVLAEAGFPLLPGTTLTGTPGFDYSKALPDSKPHFFFLFLLVRSQVEDPL